MNYYEYYVVAFREDKLEQMYGFDSLEECKGFIAFMVIKEGCKREIVQITRMEMEVIESYE